eukprot:scaffold5838_cov139-Skeletonema_menzelii.AAC.5
MVAMRVAAIMVHTGRQSISVNCSEIVRTIAYDLVCSDSAARFWSPLAKIIRTQKICSDSPLR